jgi:hypothetical protein
LPGALLVESSGFRRLPMPCAEETEEFQRATQDSNLRPTAPEARGNTQKTTGKVRIVTAS